MEIERARESGEPEKQKTPAAQVKFFGDMLKSVMPKFLTDVAVIPVFFESVKKLFGNFEAPSLLQAELLVPYLSDKANLLLQSGQIKQDKYNEVKTFLLSEFRLTPVQFKDRFERATRYSDETYTMFCSRLRNLLTYNCRSRNVEKNYDKLFYVVIADKIKCSLPESCLDYVVTV